MLYATFGVGKYCWPSLKLVFKSIVAKCGYIRIRIENGPVAP